MTEVQQLTNLKYAQDTYILTLLDAFYQDRKAQGTGMNSIRFYRERMKVFLAFCDSQQITQVDQLTPAILREFLIWLESTGHNPGGIHSFYRSLRAFLNWYDFEFEPVNWKNPIRKVPAPKVPTDPLEPVDNQVVLAMIEKCDRSTFNGARDQAIFYTLLDSGLRANELLNVDLEDLNPVTGEVLIRDGKGHKPRSVFIGTKTRKAIRKYLMMRTNPQSPALFLTDERERMTYSGLRMMVTRRAKLAGVKPPSLHSFRRSFAITMLRAGVDIFSLQRLMGHADIQILRRYLAQNNNDLITAHHKGSPVDKMGKER